MSKMIMGGRSGLKISVFWFVETGGYPTRVVSILWPFKVDNDDWDLKAVPYGHERAWPEVQKLDRTLASYSFDHFPRGRLEFYPPTRRWLLSIDEQLNRSAFIDLLVEEWDLPEGHLTVKVDPSYTSAVSINEPGTL
jgi:hypothetical protein